MTEPPDTTADPDEEGPDMFTAIDLKTDEVYRFKNMTTLVKRFRGDTYVPRPNRMTGAHNRIVHIIGHAPDGSFVVTARLRVPSEAMPESEQRRPVGRPSLGVQMYSTRLPTALLDRMAIIAERKEITKTDAVRRALTEWVNKNE